MCGGARRDRTADLLRAKQALSQLSYGPLTCLFRAWCRWLLAHFGHLHTRKLPRSLAVRLTSHEKSCVRLPPSFSASPKSSGISVRVISRSSRRSVATHSLLCERRFNEEMRKMVGLGRFELPTSPLSGVRSNQLSYRPMLVFLVYRVVGCSLAVVMYVSVHLVARSQAA